MLRVLSSLVSLRTLALTAIALVVSFGVVSTGPTAAHASSDPCSAGALRDAVTLGISGASGIAGTVNNPWIISTAEDLGALSAQATGNNSNSPRFYRQMANIDLEGCLFTPIGTGGANLHYDGGGFTISGLKISRPLNDNVGLFSWMNSGSIKNLGLVDVNVTGGDTVGGLVGYARGESTNFVTISNVFVTGVVVGSANRIGGLVGRFDPFSNSTAKLENSYSTATVQNTGTNNSAGGLVGLISSPAGTTVQVTNSYSIGELIGSSRTQFGGLVGGASPVGTIAGSFWDTDTSKMATSQGGTGKTSLQMKDLATFAFEPNGWEIVEGWKAYDFTNPGNVWGICSQVNEGYPFLLWQYSSDPCTVTATPGASSAPGVVSPAIHLDLKATARDVVAGAPVLIEGQGLQPGSAYSLVMRSTPTTVTTGTVSSGGRFSTTVNLPAGIAPGNHTITLTAIGSDGSTLSLVTTFVVSSAGTFTSISPGVGSVVGGLAATGPNGSALSLGVASSFALLVLGLAAFASSRRKTARAS